MIEWLTRTRHRKGDDRGPDGDGRRQPACRIGQRSQWSGRHQHVGPL